MEKFDWSDRKRTIFGLPWSFTRYRFNDSKLIIDTGFFSRTEDEIRLYRITDITLTRSFRERIWGLGTIHCCSGDHTSPEFDILHIKKPQTVKEMLSEKIEKSRRAYGVGMGEIVNGAVPPTKPHHDGDKPGDRPTHDSSHGAGPGGTEHFNK